MILLPPAETRSEMTNTLRRVSIRWIVTLVTTIAFAATSLLVYVTYVNVNDFDATQKDLSARANRAALAEQAYSAHLRMVYASHFLSQGRNLAAIDDFRNAGYDVRQGLNALIDASSSPRESARVATVLADHERNVTRWLSFDQLRDTPGEETAASELLASLRTETAELTDGLAALAMEGRNGLEAAFASTGSSSTSSDGLAIGLAITLACMVLISGLVYLRMVVRPVQRISEAARAIADGNTDYVAPVSGPKEVARLGVDVNAMAVSLIKRSHELNLYLSRNLEARTEELEGLNRALLRAHGELSESQLQLQEKSQLLESALEAERAVARRDALTGALNHGAIIDEIRELAAEDGSGAPFSVALVDIDAMKTVNDLYGHPFGDRVISAVSSALTLDGAVVGRYGGDEFVAVLPGMSADAAASYRSKVLENLRQTDLRPGEESPALRLTVSIGVATFPKDGADAAALVNTADIRMYRERWMRVPGGEREIFGRRIEGERSARVIGQIVPLLTGEGSLDDKLPLVCECLARYCGFDAVDIVLKPSPDAEQGCFSIYPPVPRSRRAAWREARNKALRENQMRTLLEKERRPIFVEDPAEDPRLPAFQRENMRRAGIRSLIVVPVFAGNELVGAMCAGSRKENAFGPGEAQLLIDVASQIGALATLLHRLVEVEQDNWRLRSGGSDSDAVAA